MVAYCTKDDLLTGDIPLAGKYGDGTPFVQLAADEIDAQLGHIYVTPVTFDESSIEQRAKVRPAKLLLKKINTLLASGRIVLDMAAGTEDDRLHAYGKSMRDEALHLLEMITTGKITLTDAYEIPTVADDANNGPAISNVDPYSLVEGFYTRYSDPLLLTPAYPGRPRPMRPYDDLSEGGAG